MNRAARSIRSGSSRNEISGASGVRSRPAARSTAPPYGSINSGSGSRSAIALTVKSRRDRSISMSSENSTSGLRLSGWYTSARYVVISIGTPPRMRPTVPKRLPWSHMLSAHPLTSCSMTSGPGVRREVELEAAGAGAAQEGVAHRAAHQEALVPGVDEPARDLLRGRRGVEQRLQTLGNGGHRCHSRPWVAHPTYSNSPAPSCPPRGATAQLPSPRWGCGARVSGVAATRSPPSASTAAPRSCGSTRSTPTAGWAPGCSAPGTPTPSRPPRGWHLQDRRTRTPSLWVDRPTVTDTPLPATHLRPARRSWHRSGTPNPTWPPARVLVAHTDPLPFPTEVTVSAARRPSRATVATADPSNLDELLDARSPLLARAFAAAGSGPDHHSQRAVATATRSRVYAWTRCGSGSPGSCCASSASAPAGQQAARKVRERPDTSARHRARNRRDRARTSSRSARPRARARRRAPRARPGRGARGSGRSSACRRGRRRPSRRRARAIGRACAIRSATRAFTTNTSTAGTRPRPPARASRRCETTPRSAPASEARAWRC